METELDKNIILDGLIDAQKNGKDALSSYLKDLIVIFDGYKLKLVYEIVEEFLHLGVVSLERGFTSVAQECICLFHYSVNNCDNLQDKMNEIFFTYLNRLIAQKIEEMEHQKGEDLFSFQTDLFVCMSNLLKKSYFLSIWNKYPDTFCLFASSNVRLIAHHVSLFNEEESTMCMNPDSGNHMILQKHSPRMKLIVTSCEFFKHLLDQESEVPSSFLSNDEHIFILLTQYDKLSDMEVRKTLLTLFKSMWNYLNRQTDPDPRLVLALRPSMKKKSYSLSLTKVDNIHINHLKTYKYIYLKNCTMDVNTFDDDIPKETSSEESTNGSLITENSMTTDSNRGSVLINIFCLHFYNIRNELLFIVPYDDMCMKKNVHTRQIVFHFQKETAVEVLSDKLNICNDQKLKENAQVSIGFSSDSIKNKIEETITELIKISNKNAEAPNPEGNSFESLTSTSFESSEHVSSNDQNNSSDPSEEPENMESTEVPVQEELITKEVPQMTNIKKKKVTFAQSNKIPILYTEEGTNRVIHSNESTNFYQYVDNTCMTDSEDTWKGNVKSNIRNHAVMQKSYRSHPTKTNRSCLKNYSETVPQKIGIACSKIPNEEFTSSMSIQEREHDIQSNSTTIIMDSHYEPPNAHIASSDSVYYSAVDKRTGEECSSEKVVEFKEPLFKMRLLEEIERKLDSEPGANHVQKVVCNQNIIDSVHNSVSKNSACDSVHSIYETEETLYSKDQSNEKGNSVDDLNVTTTQVVIQLLNAEQTQKNMNECLDYVNRYVSSVEGKHRSNYFPPSKEKESIGILYKEEKERESSNHVNSEILETYDSGEIIINDSKNNASSEHVPSSKKHTPRAITNSGVCEEESESTTGTMKEGSFERESTVSNSVIHKKEWNYKKRNISGKKRMSSETTQGSRSDSSAKYIIDSPYPIKRSRNKEDDRELWSILKPHKTTENELGKYLILVWAIIEYHKRTTHLKIQDDFKNIRYDVIASFEEINNRYRILKKKLQDEYEVKYQYILSKYVDRLISKKKRLNMRAPAPLNINSIIEKIKELQKTFQIIQRATEDKLSDSRIQVQYKQSDLYSPPFSIATLMSKHST